MKWTLEFNDSIGKELIGKVISGLRLSGDLADACFAEGSDRLIVGNSDTKLRLNMIARKLGAGTIKSATYDCTRNVVAKIKEDGLDFTNPVGYQMKVDLQIMGMPREVDRRIAEFDRHIDESAGPPKTA